MQIILLSGGSGKRLWPLSNNTRSKQFLKLLTADRPTNVDDCEQLLCNDNSLLDHTISPNTANGQNPIFATDPHSSIATANEAISPNTAKDQCRESMVQRVIRQVRESGLDAQVTVATSASQKDVIINQLGENVQVVTEPERRDTFPAIALASAYLKLEKSCPDDEVVVVMPCDPYTEAGYFETIAQMAKAVESGAAELVLMGIEPTYASSKYGYIVPETPSALANDSSATLANDSNSGLALGHHPVLVPEVSVDSASVIANGRPSVTATAGEAISSNAVTTAAVCNGNSCLGEIYKVQRFTEKPTEEKARELIAQNAFWNGGVFAFRLSYLMDIVGKYINANSCNSDSALAPDIPPTLVPDPHSIIADDHSSALPPSISFSEIRSRYCEFPKISFDYEVVEKAKSVAAVKYSGKWKDLGTWNTLTEELGAESIGNVLMADTANTHIVNELELPIMCIGTSDIVVAASPDGILISDKKQSEKIKSYADKLQHRPMYEERRWGEYKVIDEITHPDGSHSLTKQVLVHAGKSISYQLHNLRDEVWTFIDGEGTLVLDGVVTKVERGTTIRIAKGMKHAIKALTELRFIEVRSGVSVDEEDVERFDWQW